MFENKTLSCLVLIRLLMFRMISFNFVHVFISNTYIVSKMWPSLLCPLAGGNKLTNSSLVNHPTNGERVALPEHRLNRDMRTVRAHWEQFYMTKVKKLKRCEML